MIARLPLFLLALVTLPFVTFWIDYEFARRICLCSCVAIAMIVANFKAPRLPLGVAPTAWLVLLALAWLSGLWATNSFLGAWKVGYLAALWGCLRLGTHGTPEHWIRAALPITLAVAGLGLAQALGLDWPTGVRITQAPASTLGNLNVASEVVSLGVAASLLALRGATRRAMPLASLLLGATYLVVNGSRSGQLAVVVALAIAIVAPAAPGLPGLARRAGLLLGTSLLGTALGSWIGALRPEIAEPVTASTNRSTNEQVSNPSTLSVRKELWLGALALAAEQPLRGQGAGQFRIEYPRYRRDAEIELSSFARSFRTTVDTAHNDVLELAVEFGIWGVVTSLLVAFAIAKAAYASSAAHLAPLAAFAVLAMVRSPLANAPVAAFLFGYSGALLARHQTTSRPVSRWLALVPTLLCWGTMLAGSIVAGRNEWIVAEYLEQRTAKPVAECDVRPLEATLWKGYAEPREIGLVMRHFAVTLGPKEALAQLERLGSPDLTQVPNEPGLWFLRATVAHAAGRNDLAFAALAEVHRLDRRDPEAALLRAVLHTQAGDGASALGALVQDAHHKLRAGLASHLAELAALAERLGNQTTALRLRAEQAFVLALDQVQRSHADQDRLAALHAVDTLRDAFELANLGSTDARPSLLRAALQLARGQEQLARDLGDQATRRHWSVPSEARDLVRQVATPLRALKEWEPVLAW